jgi:hypothetical protein
MIGSSIASVSGIVYVVSPVPPISAMRSVPRGALSTRVDLYGVSGFQWFAPPAGALTLKVAPTVEVSGSVIAPLAVPACGLPDVQSTQQYGARTGRPAPPAFVRLDAHRGVQAEAVDLDSRPPSCRRWRAARR